MLDRKPKAAGVPSQPSKTVYRLTLHGGPDQPVAIDFLSLAAVRREADGWLARGNSVTIDRITTKRVAIYIPNLTTTKTTND